MALGLGGVCCRGGVVGLCALLLYSLTIIRVGVYGRVGGVRTSRPPVRSVLRVSDIGVMEIRVLNHCRTREDVGEEGGCSKENVEA